MFTYILDNGYNDYIFKALHFLNFLSLVDMMAIPRDNTRKDEKRLMIEQNKRKYTSRDGKGFRV
jgi:hypothetical protein